MDQILLGLGAAGAALLIIAIAVAVWEHRRHRAEMRLQRAWSENTRDLLQAHAKEVDARLATLAAAVHAQRPTAPAPEQAPLYARAHRAAGGAVASAARVTSKIGPPVIAPAIAPATAPATAQAGAVAAAALATAQAAVGQQWIETEPMVLTSQVLTPETDWPRMPDFDPTMPAELLEH